MNSVIATYNKGNAREHAYRPALQTLFDSLAPGKVSALNEPPRVDVGAPDFSISRGDIVIGHCEAKDTGIDLKAMKDVNLAQKKRYIGGLSNLLYTNCLEWLWYRDGELKHEIRIADFLMGVQPIPERYHALEAMLRDFIAQTPQTITSSRALAERMAGKAVLIKDVLANSLLADKDGESELMGQYHAFKEHLIHDISIKDFADIYAETITYGMFAARLHDPTPNTFSRQEALELLPKSNPFLRNLFGYIAGPNLDTRISWIIDDLAVVFRASNVAALMAQYGKTTQRNDPFLHFYEDFLKAYNPDKRDARGVWYTPEPVVNFIVRAVDDVLKTEFGLADGLADTSKVTIDLDTGQRGLTSKNKLTKSKETIKEKREVHRVQILDPATGTGTFLAEVIKQIAPRVKDKAPGMWARYVEKDLIPRLHGFELLMASYAMCHLKLDMVLREFGYQPTENPPRVSVYLTNSLEEGEAADQRLPFAQWLSNEVREANKIKRDMPIMCVIGNPPYSGHSLNTGDWISALIDAYKKEPGGKEKLNERNPKWLNDDYVKFIRMAESMIDKNGQGVLGFITNHSYLDNPTFRGMRWHLLKTFDKLYVVDLHGNAKRKEVAPDGSADKNVFDIQQGVAIIICVKRPTSGESTELRRADFWGERQAKYDRLWTGTLSKIEWATLNPVVPHLTFSERDEVSASVYEQWPLLNNIFQYSALGFQTHRDEFAIAIDRSEITQRLQDFVSSASSDVDIKTKYALRDNRDWSVLEGRKLARSATSIDDLISRCTYRPFDDRFCVLSEVAMDYPRPELNRHARGKENIFLLAPRQLAFLPFTHCLVSANPAESCAISNKTKEQNLNYPLYLYSDPSELDQTRRVNFEPKLYAKLRKLATHPVRGEPDEIAVFDYIYGVLHCPAYRETYAEFLKNDFPRIPWPASPDVFWDVSDKGDQLRRLHLMEPAAIGETPYPFVGEGDGKVDKPEFHGGHVWINKDQRFENAPEISWGFYIGGYQPAQKWLKDRKGRTLDFEDVQHYQRILKILAETDRIMKTIEMPLG
jgi:hypothetical protein